MVDYDGMDSFSSHMTQPSAKNLDNMSYSVAVGDINAYFIRDNERESIYIVGGEAFVKAGYTAQAGDRGRVCRTQYGLGTSGHEWYVVLTETLRELGLKLSKGSP